MTRKLIALILAWALSLIIVGVFAHAQTLVQRGCAQNFISGNDIGFQAQGRQGDHVSGTLKVRINGQWVSIQPVAGAKALSFK